MNVCERIERYGKKIERRKSVFISVMNIYSLINLGSKYYLHSFHYVVWWQKLMEQQGKDPSLRLIINVGLYHIEKYVLVKDLQMELKKDFTYNSFFN